ncbi:efflux RND transporter periplasmic adaptor subunit [Superficieibacter sp. 1612_C1]|uniref:efflux RND transporter periplasmic adaptor subunit n=1 Tax=Superficieibacter sp. 1612_C1 TaxID=2780382 RepID=UPI001884196E|nr:efflux RND transporter periplasmic adaptor subunit [Superficieibacter sp. 1612_C1]
MKKGLLAALILAVVAAGIGYYAGRQASQPAAQTPAQAGRKVLYWYDPMVPDRRFDKPGKSPFMDMPLVARYADDSPAQGGVTISAEQQQNLGMKVTTVEKRLLAADFSAFATVTTDERSLRVIPSPASGVVEKLFVRAPQQWVKAGEPLAQLWIPDWTVAQQEYLAVRQLGDAALTRAARERLGLQFMPAATIRELERSGKPQTRITLRAEQAGYVAKLETREGAQVAATAPLFELASLDPVWLIVDYPQTQAARLAPGSEVIALSDSWPGEQFHGQVSELLPQLETTTRTLRARIVLENPQQKLKPGMFLTVKSARAQQGLPVLAVPEESLIATGNDARVLLTDGKGHFSPVAVTTGITANGWTEIKSGLQEGAQVVTSGQFLIDSEASLRSALPEHATVKTYETTGVVQALDGNIITLAHQPVPELNWGAMTMDFTLKRPVSGISTGDRVTFSFTLDDEQGATIVHLMPAGEVMK